MIPDYIAIETLGVIYWACVTINAFLTAFALQRYNRQRIPLNKRAGHPSALVVSFILSPITLLLYIIFGAVSIIKRWSK